jgi:hypothetical protein
MDDPEIHGTIEDIATEFLVQRRRCVVRARLLRPGAVGVQNGYVSAGTGGYARPLQER